MEKPAKREQLASRLGFLLISAGCAIGLGNVWRFPFITGEYGGACFLLLFIVCQLMVMPVMICEFAIGRASRLNLGMALGRLEPRGTKWHKFSWLNIVGIYTLLMFYTTICGWIVLYTWYMFTGTFEGLPPDAVGKFFGSFTGSAGQMTLGMSLSVLCGAAVCFLGLQNGVERIVKFMMAGLFIILVILAVHSMTLPGAPEGLSFYLKPDLEKFRSIGFFPIASAALEPGLLHPVRGRGLHVHFRKLHQQRALSPRRSLFHHGHGLSRGPHRGPHHLPGLLHLRRASLLRARVSSSWPCPTSSPPWRTGGSGARCSSSL